MEFNEALNLQKTENIFYDIKDLVMAECIKDKRINKDIYTNEELKLGDDIYLRIAFNTNEEYMLTMAHIRENLYKLI